MVKSRLDSVSPEQYQNMANRASPPSPLFKHCIWAFLVGGAICLVGLGVRYLGQQWLGLDDKQISSFVAIVMVFLGATFTGLGWYDQLGTVAGAGSVVPITGFANSIVAPAMEYKREGYVMGMGARMFNLAGPVLVFGVSTAVVAGILYYFFG